ARAEAERASRAKSDFLAVMSHELRTPLNAIGGYAQLLEMGVHGPVNDAQRDALVRLGRSQANLLRLINDVLNFAKLDAGQVRYAVADVMLDETLASLDPLVAPQVSAKGLTFTWQPCGDLPLTVRADPDKLQQVVLNVVTNAIKFTPAGGSIAIECDATDDDVHVRVRDTGVGIPAERLPFIFEPFVQGDRALNRPHEGVGLGLAISRDLARGMGGDLTVESVVGGGSVFTISLPRSATLRGGLRAADCGLEASRSR
ncbi:MAG: HAMP domain-containing histidine kinase, partial [Gemmatimonadota bacterium]|nr:HAMP domain-containing histidine kinase [Gemmatimonadota bacterium]